MMHEKPDKSAEAKKIYDREMFDMIQNAQDSLTETMSSWQEFAEGESRPWPSGIWRKFKKGRKVIVYISEYSDVTTTDGLTYTSDKVHLTLEESGIGKLLDLETTTGVSVEHYGAGVHYDEWVTIPAEENMDGMEKTEHRIYGDDATDIDSELDGSDFHPLSKGSQGMIFTNGLIDEFKKL